MQQRTWVVSYIFLDWLSGLIAWSVFFYLRKIWIEKVAFKWDENFIIGIAVVPFLWLLLYFVQGTYVEMRRMFRLKILNLTLIATIIGSILLFFGLILDDTVNSYQDYYQSFLLVFGIHFFVAGTSRIFLTTLLVKHIRKPGNGFKTLILGGNEKACGLYKELTQLTKNSNYVVGYCDLNGIDFQLSEYVPNLGDLKVLEEVIEKQQIEEVIIAIESSDHGRLRKLISRINDGKVKIKILPDMFEILSGSTKMSNIYGALLMEVSTEVMPFWQQTIKRFLDLFISFIAIVLLTPLYVFSAIAVKLSSPGPIFYLQERVGLNGKTFKIIKFRTMYVNAEAKGPQLSSAHDPRITPIGRFMRKTRLDEFPQFLNVIIGQMSLVGPRPERQFYIDQIIEVEPQYLHLTRVRPGITSWGQVKFGYAENVEQMLERMKFDLLYLKNRSLALDFKIMFYTVIIIFKAKGK